jgi:hypothetical protein
MNKPVKLPITLNGMINANGLFNPTFSPQNIALLMTPPILAGILELDK